MNSESPVRGDIRRSMNSVGIKIATNISEIHTRPVSLSVILLRHSSSSNQKTEILMELKSQYKVISGAPLEIEETLNLLSQDGWHPVTIASLCLPSVVAVILESKVIDESSRKITSALQHAVSLEDDVQ